MEGGRRVRATSVLPRFGPPCLFKGHLSTKSNAFCTDSSSLRLSTLHLIETHMAIHYNKILSAKAAVDCSIPISLTTSIKYADQQRREKLKKELAQYQRDFKLSKTAGQAKSKNNSRSLFTGLEKPSGDPQVEDEKIGFNFVKEVNRFSSFPRPLVTSSESLCLNLPKSSEVFSTGTKKHASSSQSITDYNVSEPRKPCSRVKNVRRPKSTFSNSHRFQLVISKASNGDLLDKHSDLFSNTQLPFTPRTLKSEAKSFLSQYRYYTPAKRKQNLADPQTEAETQAEPNSLKSDCDAAADENVIDSELALQQVSSCLTYKEEEITHLPLEIHGLAWDSIKNDTPQYSSSKEELLYLSFIENITEDILKVGLFSNRFLEQLFERHIKQNKHHLEEDKMRQMLHILKVDLGCISKENSVTINVGMSNLSDFETDGSSKQDDSKTEQDIELQLERKQYLKALDMLLSLPKDENELSSPSDFHLPPHKSKSSEEVIVQQVNDEPTWDPLKWVERSAAVSDSPRNQDACVNVVVVDSDCEEAELSSELCCLDTALPQPEELCGVQDDDDTKLTEELSLEIIEISTQNCTPVTDQH
ncbi:spermatogenesis-associated protein 7 isoform X2 [Sorex fumeus]|uniref:spermatogenesis-associated protein 7 isoform X2 n=1 Tax=Sorex fumeus TaxID=62283 RepID=UPI0024AD903D|nr:spermatogenesis-associated protein 7 isoform X2 [Sorex fumeus]